MKTKTAIIQHSSVGGFDTYRLIQLKNAASISIDDKFFRVGDRLEIKEVDAICELNHWDVTVKE